MVAANEPSEPMAYKVVNLTGHPIVIVHQNREVTYQPSGKVCRVDTRQTGHSSVTLPGLGPVTLKILPSHIGNVTGLPDPENGVVYLVSSMVLDALIRLGINRPDVLACGTRAKFGVIRGRNSEIIGVTTLMGMGQ